MINTIRKNTLIALQFLRRDFYSSGQFFGRYLMNFGVLRPLLFAFSFIYIQAHVVLQTQSPETITFLIIGNSLVALLALACNIAMKHLFDREKKRLVDYQLCLLDSHFIIFERVTFITLYTFILLLPYFPMMKLFMGNYFDTSHVSWPATYFILFLGALCCSSYLVLALSVVRSSKHISSLWTRVNIPLLWLGGLWAPLSVIKKKMPLLGTIARINPLTYITEGLRAAVLGTRDFIPLYACAGVLIIFSLVFITMTFPVFRKRTDHV